MKKSFVRNNKREKLVNNNLKSSDLFVNIYKPGDIPPYSSNANQWNSIDVDFFKENQALS